jgi:hypothetical protein
MKATNPPEDEQETEDENALFQAYEDAVNQGDVAAVEAATLQVWQHLAEVKDDEPSPWRQAMGEAHRCETAFEWPGAIEAYKNAISTSPDQPMLQSKAHSQLAALYGLLDQNVLASEAARAATEAARREGISSLISFALQGEAKLLLQAKNFPAAWEKMEEAWQVIGAGPMHDLERAYCLTLRGHYFVAVGEPDSADAPLNAAWKLLEPWAEMFYAGGWQGGLANWWTATARLRALRGDKDGAVVAWQEAIERRRVVSFLPQLEGPYKHNTLAVALWDFGKYQQEIGDPLASESLEESRSIRQAIGLPPLVERDR